MNKKILITGASGFVGSHLARLLKSIGYEIFFIKREFFENDYKEFEKKNSFLKNQFSYLIHLASYTEPGTFCKNFPGDQFITNEFINLKVLDLWKNFCPDSVFIGLGTSVSYPPDLKNLEEKNYFKINNDLNYIGYWSTKRSLLYGLIALSKQYNLKYLYLIPSMIYGEGYNIKKKNLHFIYDIIIKILYASKKSEQAVLWGDGYQKREVIHINQFCNHFLKLMNKNITNTIINVGSGESFTIKEIANKITNILKLPNNIVSFDNNAFVGAKEKVLNCEKLWKLDQHTKKIDLDDGLKSTIHWVQKELYGN